MKKILLLFLIILVFPVLIFSFKDSFEYRLGAFLKNKINEYNVPGLVCSYVRNGKVKDTYSYGFSNLESNIKINSEETLFKLNDLTEIFNSYLFLKLKEDGKVDLNIPIKDYSDINNEVSLFNLLTHTTGYDFSKIGIDKKINLKNFLIEYKPKKLYSSSKFVLPTFYDKALSEYLISYLMKENYIQILNKEIFSKLNMENTFYDYPLPLYVRANKAIGYDRNNKSLINEKNSFMYFNKGYTTINDFNKFLIEILNPKKLKFDIIKNFFSEKINEYSFVRTFALNERKINEIKFYYLNSSSKGFSSSLIVIPSKNIGFSLFYNKNMPELYDDFLDFIVENFVYLKPVEIKKMPFENDIIGTYLNLNIPNKTSEKFYYLNNGNNKVVLKKLRDNKLRILNQNKVYDYLSLDNNNTFFNLDKKSIIKISNEKNSKILYLKDKIYKKLKWYENPDYYNFGTLIGEIILILILIFLIFKYIKNLKHINELNFEIIFDSIIFIECIFILFFTVEFFKTNYFVSGLNGFASLIPFLVLIISFFQFVFTIISLKKNYLTFMGIILYILSTVDSLIFISFFKYYNFL
ncbi:hypothetical protein OSSY52_17350 [Tepiditoga spiralis]|uniref:Beta-lactamase-related domain-containing protein n=1 Tax=Tepiditoga spiralis TaxID=2108365 RepID=A0A7G1G8M7_9BACT|nr:serine hydrolase domain-containing protein [Tepiditoga spiralis]BBE31594.1 hypothetical protein OSSY52_17350 [Tepiditoga spiralis]